MPKFLSCLMILLIACGVAMAQATRPSAPSAASSEQRKPHDPLKDGEVREFRIKDLANFAYDPERGGGIPQDVKQFDGKTVRVVGFMLPAEVANNIARFTLVSDLASCCFGAWPQVQHIVSVECPPGKTVAYYPEEIVCEGVLTVSEKREQDYTISIFELKVTKVSPAAK